MISIETVSDSKEILKAIAVNLLNKRLVACTHLTKISYSSYIWKGEIVEKKEYKLKVKTIEKYKKDVVSVIKENHNYEVFELLLNDVSNINKDYQEWFEKELK